MMKTRINEVLDKQFVRYALVGGIATFIHLFIAFLFIWLIAPSSLIANVLGFCCAFIFSYLMQSQFVFKQITTLTNAWRFFVVQFSALMTAQLISLFLSSYSPYWRVIFVVLLLPICTYFIHRIWTYKEH